MAKNDINNQRGSLGELQVAQALVETGCVVNFLSFMDVGLDLFVQLPAGLVPPEAGRVSWEMSGRSVHVQVKSTKTGEVPGIATETAREWTRAAPFGALTVLVVVVLDEHGKPEFRFFDPLLIKLYSDKTRSEAFKIPVHAGQTVDPHELFGLITEWLDKSRYYLSSAIPFVWSPDKEVVWMTAVDMVARLTLIHERAFRDAGLSLDDQRDFQDTAEGLMVNFLRGAGLETDLLDEYLPGETRTVKDELFDRTFVEINGAASDKHGWPDWVDPLGSVSPSSDEYGAKSYLSELCYAYGLASRNRVKLPL